MRFTPMRDWMRGRLSGCLDVVRLVEQTQLPAEAQSLILQAVRRTRLWRDEKIDVAMELIAHFQDGLDAGVSADDLVEMFGPIKPTAKLIRRGKKRNRPMWWKVSHASKQLTLVFVYLYFLVGVALMVDSPTPTVDYLAKINAPALAVPVEDQAWPIYREAFIEYEFYDLDITPLYMENHNRNLRLIRPDQAEWPRMVAFLESRRGLLDAIRLGGEKAGLGLTVGYDEHWTGDDRLALYGPDYEFSQSGPVSGAEALSKFSLIAVLMPELSSMRKMARLIHADTLLAAQQGDGKRIVSNIRTLVGLIRQSRENPMLLSDLIAQSISAIIVESLNHVLPQHVHLLTDVQLTKLAHHIGSLNDIRTPDFDDIEWTMEDTFQRIYGSSGRITYEGLRVLKSMNGLTVLAFSMASANGVLFGGDYAVMMATPLAAVLIASRDEMSQQLQRLMAMLKEDAHRLLCEMYLTRSRIDAQVIEWKKSYLVRIRYLPLVLLMPAVDRIGQVVRQQHAARQAVLVALAAELYRRDHGTYPETIDAMVPRYLPTAPVDESAESGTLILKVTGDSIIVYGRGLDGDDDGGVMPADYIWPRLDETKEDGDWVLYPPPEEE